MIFGSPDSVAPTSKRTKASLSELDFATNDLLRPTVSSITISLFLVALSFALAIWGFVEYAKNKDQVEATCSVSSLLLTLNVVIASSDCASTVLSIASILLLLSAYIKISWNLYSDNEEDEERDFDEPTKIMDRNEISKVAHGLILTSHGVTLLKIVTGLTSLGAAIAMLVIVLQNAA